MLSQYSLWNRTLLGRSLLGNEQAGETHVLLSKGELYTGSDGSEKDSICVYDYGFTSVRLEMKSWGGAALTPGNVEDMALLCTRLGGDIWLLLVIYTLHIQRGHPNQLQYG